MSIAATIVEHAETEEFIPGSVTDTCGVCFERFELQRPADQYKTVRNWGTDTWDLICGDCDDEIAVQDERGPMMASTDRIPDGTIVTGTRGDIAGHRHEITGYDPQTALYTARYLPPGGGLTTAGRGSPGLERKLYAAEFSVEEEA